MLLTLQRRPQQPHSTPGILAVDGVFECFDLEPPADGVPFPRIAAGGPWDVTLRPSPKFQQMAKTDPWVALYCDMMPHIEYKPNSVTMLHFGNKPDQTHDCPLVGKDRAEDYVGNSRSAFTALHAKIVNAIASGAGCKIEILDCANNHDNVQQATDEA